MPRAAIALAVPVAIAIAAVAPRARACSVCGCGDPLVAASDARPISGRLRVGVDFEYLTAQARSDEVPADQEALTQISLRPLLVYSPEASLNLVAQVPLVQKDWSLSDASGQRVDANKSFGLGDVDLGARWFLLDEVDLEGQSRWNLALSAGSSLPTGGDDAQSNGQRIDDHAQLGTGAFSPYLGALYAFHRDPWNVFVSATVRTHTTNAYGYRFGSALLVGARAEYRIVDRLAVGLGLDARQAAHDTLFGDRQDNTGGFLLALSPGIMADVVGDLWLYLRVQVPIASHLYGEQQFGPVWLASLQYAFGGG